MKKVAKIDPEKEYENAKKLIEMASKERLDTDNAGSLDSSVDNLITAARILMEREERRRGRKKTPKESRPPKGRQKGDDRKESKKIPSERFPDLEIEEKIVAPEHTPQCPCCGDKMKESGLFDTSEKLEIIPKKYYIVRTMRPKYNCSHCHGSIINTPSQPSIVPTSNYGDSFIIDVSLSKYCDLIPMERYAQIAFRDGLINLPPQSLIGLTHHLANFLTPIYELIKQEVLLNTVLLADETTHKMLEGDETYNWYLWGFFSQCACYLEAHNTRSGDVAFNFLKESKAKYLMSDGYAGYSKAIRLCKEKLKRKVIEVHCNAHAYRYFKDASDPWKEESKPFLELYGEIYKLERQMEGLPANKQLELRQQMVPFFEQMKQKCEKQVGKVMVASGIEKSINYFLNHYDGLSVCTTNIDIPLDNNLSERELRAPVVGRKTWYGTHSKRGAQTTAALFSIVQSCKLNNINPRKYFPWVVERILYEEELLTPHQYSLLPDLR